MHYKLKHKKTSVLTHSLESSLIGQNCNTYGLKRNCARERLDFLRFGFGFSACFCAHRKNKREIQNAKIIGGAIPLRKTLNFCMDFSNGFGAGSCAVGFCDPRKIQPLKTKPRTKIKTHAGRLTLFLRHAQKQKPPNFVSAYFKREAFGTSAKSFALKNKRSGTVLSQSSKIFGVFRSAEDAKWGGFTPPALGVCPGGANAQSRARVATTARATAPEQNPERSTKSKNLKDKVVSITYEEIGLFPRSFSRVLDRFLKQIFSDVENLVIQEYRFYRYLFLTTIQTIFVLVFVPLFVNFIAKTYLIRPVTEYFWNTKQTEIFLNSYEQKRAFLELQDFEEKLYFESLLTSNSSINTQNVVLATQNQNLLVESNQAIELPNAKQQSEGLNLFNSLNNVPEGQRDACFGEKSQTTSNASLGNQPTNSYNSALFVLPQNCSPRDMLYAPEGLQSKTQMNFVQTLTSFNSNTDFVAFSEERLDLDFPRSEKSKPKTQSGSIASAIQNSNLLQERLQEKTVELAIRYNNHSIESITNFFADFLSLLTLLYLLVSFEIQINITKSFLLEVFFGLDDSKKSLLILIMTDLLVGYHSSNLWELFFQFLFNHYGIPESQTGIFLLVATLPVLLDVLFKYLIFRHLNRASPATVATYHAIIE